MPPTAVRLAKQARPVLSRIRAELLADVTDEELETCLPELGATPAPDIPRVAVDAALGVPVRANTATRGAIFTVSLAFTSERRIGHNRRRMTRVDAQREQFIERMGLISEADGLPRIAGRIFGYLLLTPGECSLEDLASALGVSRASVSNDTRRLAQMGFLERRSRPGDRRDYYIISPDAFRRSIEHRIGNLRRFHGLINEARVLVIDQPEVRERLAKWEDAHRLVVAAFEELLQALDARTGPPRNSV